MLALDARFTILAVLCFLSTQWLLPSLSANAAVISRNPGSSASPFHHPVNDASSLHSQHVLPWASKGRFHKVRSTNPIQQFADTLISRIKHAHRKRSHKTIIIPTGHGNGYFISHKRRAETPQWISGHKNMTNTTTTASTQSENTGTPGAVRIQSQTNDPTHDSQTLGSLFLTYDNGVYTLNASDNNETQLYMVNAPTTTRDLLNTSSNKNTPVFLAIPGLKDSKDYCATYNSSPDKPEPMTMQECGNSTAGDGSSNSQIFMFNKTSNELHLSWNDGSNGSAQAAPISSDVNANSTGGTSTATSAQASPTGLNSRDNSYTQNVTLVWVHASKVAAADISETPENSQNHESTSSAVTTTMTQTVTVFQTGSMSSTTISTSVAPSSTGLNVEVVGGSPVSSSASLSSASSMSMMDVPNSSVTSSLPAPSQSINATAIASSIASSASASISSVSASSASAMASAADFPASASSTASSDPSSNTFVAAVMERAAWVRPEVR